MKKIAIGCDHGGIELKSEIKKYLSEEGYEVKDFEMNNDGKIIKEAN